MIPATQLRVGMVIQLDGKLYRVVSKEHITPGNWRAMVQTKMRSLEDGTQSERRFRSTETVETPQMETQVLQYLYAAGNQYHFMNTESYDQIALDTEVLGDRVYYLKEGIEIKALVHEGRILDVELPTTVDLAIADTQPPMKGATASGSPKPATLETGLQVKVPQHLTTGAVVRVDTRDGSFVQKVS
jgi:elongation factor P